MSRYEDANLQFHHGPEAFRVTFRASIGSASGPTAMDLDPSTMRDLNDRILAALKQSTPRDARIDSELAQLGDRLYKEIFPEGAVREALIVALQPVLNSAEERLRLFLHFDSRDPELAWLAEFPWDVLRIPLLSPAPNAALDHRLSIVRAPDVTRPFEPRAVVPPLKVLLVRAGARGLGGLQLGEEQDSITEALKSVGGFELHSVDMPTRHELRGQLRDLDPHVVHLMGHGRVDEDTGSGWVYLRDEAGDPLPLRPEDIPELFSGLLAPRLVVLNACVSGRGSLLLQGSGGSIAGALIAQGAGAVVAMQFAISDKAAKVFAEDFYARLVKGAQIDDALTEGRLAMRSKIPDTFEWCTPALYMRTGEAGVLFQPEPQAVAPVSSGRPLTLIRHEAYARATEQPGPEDAPTLFVGRTPRLVTIDHTPALEQRHWSNLEAEVKRLAAPDGELRRAFAERDTDVAYYGFPFVPLAVLAGFLAKNRPVHVFEYLSNRFQWEPDSDGAPPPLNVDMQTRSAGTVAQVRVSVSAIVDPEDCRQVLPDTDVRLDLHFALSDARRESVRSEKQLKGYVQVIRDTLERQIAANRNPAGRPESVHLFAAVPVSLAFHLGAALTPSWLRECFVYNYGFPSERPRYKWRLSLQAAYEGRRSIKIFR